MFQAPTDGSGNRLRHARWRSPLDDAKGENDKQYQGVFCVYVFAPPPSVHGTDVPASPLPLLRSLLMLLLWGFSTGQGMAFWFHPPLTPGNSGGRCCIVPCMRVAVFGIDAASVVANTFCQKLSRPLSECMTRATTSPPPCPTYVLLSQLCVEICGTTQSNSFAIVALGNICECVPFKNNVAFSLLVPGGKCDAPCRGAETKICGGSMAFDLYQLVAAGREGGVVVVPTVAGRHSAVADAVGDAAVGDAAAGDAAVGDAAVGDAANGERRSAENDIPVNTGYRYHGCFEFADIEDEEAGGGRLNSVQMTPKVSAA